jgi:CRP-like cAMP-binding protein
MVGLKAVRIMTTAVTDRAFPATMLVLAEQTPVGLKSPPHAAARPAQDASGRSPQARERRAIIDVAPSLFDAATNEPLGEPTRRLAASVLHVGSGPVDITRVAPDPWDWIGLLILDGLLLVELAAGRAHTGWLIGAEDIVCPWDMGEISLNQSTRWRALTPVRIALLDHDFSIRAGGIPIVARALVKKTARTTNWLLAKSLMLASPLIEERLLLAFALFGERWGIVNHDGVLVKLPLTHAVLATLCGARRPSVTIALHSLQASGLLTRTDEGHWLLRRGACTERKARPSCWPEYATALGLADAASAQPATSPPPAAIGAPAASSAG